MLEFTLRHDGRDWIATNGALSARANTLAELDGSLAKKLDGWLSSARSSRVVVRMNFDNTTIPKWMRQFSGHYFDRIVTLELGQSADGSKGEIDG